MGHDHEHEHDHDHDHDHYAALGPGDFTQVKPILNVASVPASLAYYTQTLGFQLVFAWGEAGGFDQPAAPTFAEVRRGLAHVMLAQNEQGGPGMWLYLDVRSAAEVDALHAEVAARGARIAAAPADRPWGQREMFVHDLDGHTLRVGGPLEHA